MTALSSAAPNSACGKTPGKDQALSAAAGGGCVDDPLRANIELVKKCILDFEHSNCLYCSGKTCPTEAEECGGVCGTDSSSFFCSCGEEIQQMRQRMRSTLQLVLLLLQMDSVGHRLQRHLQGTATDATEAVENDTAARLPWSGDLSAGEAALELFARQRCLRLLMGTRLWLQWESGLAWKNKQSDEVAALARADFRDSAMRQEQQRYVSSTANATGSGRGHNKLGTFPGDEQQEGFYHMDWPYSNPRLDSEDVYLDRFADRPAAISAQDSRAADSFFRCLWRRVRSGDFRRAEGLAAAKGASWLIEVLHGRAQALAKNPVVGLLINSASLMPPVGSLAMAALGGDSWVEPYSLTPPPSHEELFCFFDCKELEFLTGASWILRTALGRSGVTVKDATAAHWESDSPFEEEVVSRKRIAEGGNSSHTGLLLPPEESNNSLWLGVEGEGKPNTDLFRYVCGLILDGDLSSHSCSRMAGTSVPFEPSLDSKTKGFDIHRVGGKAIGDSTDGGGYSMGPYEKALIGFLFGDLEAVHAVADCWADSIFAIVNSLHEELSAGLLRAVRDRQSDGLFVGEVDCIAKPSLAAAVAAAGTNPPARKTSLCPANSVVALPAVDFQEQISDLLLKLISRFAGAVRQLHPRKPGQSLAGITVRHLPNSMETSHGNRRILRDQPKSEETARLLESPEALDRAVLALFFNLMSELPLLAAELGGSEGSACRISMEHGDDFRLLQLYLIAAFIEAPYASSRLSGGRCLGRAGIQQSEEKASEPPGGSAVNAAPAPHSATVLHLLKQMASEGARVCIEESGTCRLTLMFVTLSAKGNPAWLILRSFTARNTGSNREVQRFACLLAALLSELRSPLRGERAGNRGAFNYLFELDPRDCGLLVGQVVAETLEQNAAGNVFVSKLCRRISPERRARVFAGVLCRKMDFFLSDDGARLDACVAWICHSFPSDALLVVARVAEFVWSETWPVVTAAAGAASGFDECELGDTGLEAREERALRRTKFLLQLLLSVFSLFYLDDAMKSSIRKPLLQLTWDRRSLAEAECAAVGGCVCSLLAETAPFESTPASSGESQLDLCFFGCYCLSLATYAAFCGVVLETAAARRSALRRLARQGSESIFASEALSAAGVGNCEESKCVEDCSVGSWLLHALKPGLVVPLVCELLSCCKSSAENMDGVLDGFETDPALLLVAPLAKDLPDALRCIREEGFSFRAYGRLLPTLPLRQYFSLEAFVTLQGGALAAEPSVSSSLDRALEGLAGHDFFPLLKDEAQEALHYQRKAVELERHLQLEQLEMRLNALQRQQAGESRLPVASFCSDERNGRSLKTHLEAQLLKPEQREVQDVFSLPAFCEGAGLPGCTCCGSASAAALASAVAAQSVATALPRLRSRLLADLQLIYVAFKEQDASRSVQTASLARLLALGGSRRINPAEAAEPLFLECLRASSFT